MSLFTRLKSLYVLGKCVKFNSASKHCYHSFRKISRGDSPPFGTRSLWKLLRKPSQSDLKKADDIPDAFDLIYRNTMSRYIFGAQIIAIVTGSMVIMALCFRSEYPDFKQRTLKWSEGSRAVEHEDMYYCTFFIIILCLVQVMISRIPIRIYKKPRTDKYIAINYGHYIFGKERYTFRRGEISQLPEKGILPWKSNRFLIEGKNSRRIVILVDYFFRRPADLDIMLGEQKDPDLEEDEEDVKK